MQNLEQRTPMLIQPGVEFVLFRFASPEIVPSLLEPRAESLKTQFGIEGKLLIGFQISGITLIRSDHWG